MPRPKLSNDKYSKLFLDAHTQASRLNETNDCGVKLVVILTGKSYAEVHAFMKKAGRKDRQGTPWTVIHSAFSHFGYKLVGCAMRQDFIFNYPGAHKNLRSVTTHHPTRFNKVWKDGKSYVFDCGTHVAAVIDGETHDWTNGTARRVNRVYRVEKIDQSVTNYVIASRPKANELVDGFLDITKYGIDKNVQNAMHLSQQDAEALAANMNRNCAFTSGRVFFVVELKDAIHY